MQQVSYDDGGGSDSGSGHDVYLERVKAEGQEHDSEDGTLAAGAVGYSQTMCVLVCFIHIEDSDFVAHGSGSDDALELVDMHRTSMLTMPTADMMSLLKTAMRINLLLKRNHAASPNHLRAPRGVKRYVVKHNEYLATRSLDLSYTV